MVFKKLGIFLVCLNFRREREKKKSEKKNLSGNLDRALTGEKKSSVSCKKIDESTKLNLIIKWRKSREAEKKEEKKRG